MCTGSNDDFTTTTPNRPLTTLLPRTQRHSPTPDVKRLVAGLYRFDSVNTALEVRSNQTLLQPNNPIQALCSNLTMSPTQWTTNCTHQLHSREEIRRWVVKVELVPEPSVAPKTDLCRVCIMSPPSDTKLTSSTAVNRFVAGLYRLNSVNTALDVRSSQKVSLRYSTACIARLRMIPSSITYLLGYRVWQTNQVQKGMSTINLIHTRRATRCARKFEHKSFDVACMQCEHFHP